MARPPSALMKPTICLLIEPASTISTISTVARSVMRKPAANSRLDAELFQHGADLRAAAMHDDGIDAGLLKQNHVAGEAARDGFVAHGVAAVFHDDDRIVIVQHMRQRLHQDFGLLAARAACVDSDMSLIRVGRAPFSLSARGGKAQAAFLRSPASNAWNQALTR